MALRNVKGKLRTENARAKDMPAVSSVHERPADHDGSGRFASGNAAAKDREAKRAIWHRQRTALQAAGASADDIRREKKKLSALWRAMPSRSVNVLDLLEVRCRNECLAALFTVAAHKAGLASPEGMKLAEQARGHDQTAHRHSLLAHDLAAREAGLTTAATGQSVADASPSAAQRMREITITDIQEAIQEALAASRANMVDDPQPRPPADWSLPPTAPIVLAIEPPLPDLESTAPPDEGPGFLDEVGPPEPARIRIGTHRTTSSMAELTPALVDARRAELARDEADAMADARAATTNNPAWRAREAAAWDEHLRVTGSPAWSGYAARAAAEARAKAKREAEVAELDARVRARLEKAR